MRMNSHPKTTMNSHSINLKTKLLGIGWRAFGALAAFLAVSLTAFAQTTPTVTWATPADITYGTLLTDNQLNAVVTSAGVNVPGTATYKNPAGTVVATENFNSSGVSQGLILGASAARFLNAGNGQSLRVDFAPANTSTFNAVNATVSLNVLPAPLLITVAGRSMTYGQILPLVTAADTSIPITNITAQGSITNGAVTGINSLTTAASVVTYTNLLAYLDGTSAQQITLTNVTLNSAFPTATNTTYTTNSDGFVTQNNTVVTTNVFSNTTRTDVLNTDRTVTGRLAGDTNALGVVIAAVINGVATNIVQPGTPVGRYQFLVQFVDPQNKLQNYNVQINQNFLDIRPVEVLARTVSKSKIYGDIDPSYTTYSGGALTNYGNATAAGNGSSATSTGPGRLNYWNSGDIQFVSLVESDGNDTDPGNQNHNVTNTVSGFGPGSAIGNGTIVSQGTAGRNLVSINSRGAWPLTAFAPCDLQTNIVQNTDLTFTTNIVLKGGVLTQTFNVVRSGSTGGTGGDVGTVRIRVDQGALSANYVLRKIDENNGGRGANNRTGTRNWFTSQNQTGGAVQNTDQRGITISRRTLTVVPDNKSITYRDALPTFTGSISNAVASDGISISSASFSTTATATSDAGTYPITAGVATTPLNDPNNRLGNYTVNTIPGTLTISKAPLTVTFNTFNMPFNVTQATGIGFDFGAGLQFPGAFTVASDGVTARLGNPAVNVFGSAGIKSSQENILTVIQAMTIVTTNSAGVEINVNPGNANYGIGSYVITARPSSITSANYNVTVVNGRLNVAVTQIPASLFNGVWVIPGQPFTYGKILGDAELKNVAFNPPNIAGFYTNFVGVGYDITKAVPVALDSTGAVTTRRVVATFVVTGPDTNSFLNTTVTNTFTVNPKLLTIAAPGYFAVGASTPPGGLGSYPAISAVSSISVDYGSDAGLLQPIIDPEGKGQTFITGESVANLTIQPVIASTRALNSGVNNTNRVVDPNNAAATVPEYASEVNITAGGAVTSSSISGTSPAYRIYFAQNPRSANYNIRLIEGRMTVLATTLQVIAEDKRVGYGSPLPPATIRYVGFKLGQTNTTSGLLGAQPVAQYPSGAADASGNVVLTPGTYPITVGGAFSLNGEYNVQHIGGTLTVDKGDVPISWPDPSPIVYGTALSTNQLNATSGRDSAGNLIATVTYTQLGAVLPAGTNTITATITPIGGNSSFYNTRTVSKQIVVNRAVLTVTADNKARPFGSANPAFTFSITGFYDGETASVLTAQPVGSTTATAASPVGAYPITLSGAAAANYSFTYVPGTLTVGSGTPVITWNNPAAITFGTALSSAQLNATASIAGGTFTYSPAAGTVLNAGVGQQLSVTFTPSAADAANFSPVTKTVTIDVNKANPTITWVKPANITFNTALGSAQLNATASVAGTFTYSPASGTKLPVGTSNLTVTFSPNDLNYNTATATVQITVEKATPIIAWSNPADITPGTALSGIQLNAVATVAGQTVSGQYIYSPPAGTVLPTGAGQKLGVFFIPDDAANVNFANGTALINVGTPGPSTPPTITLQPVSVTVTAGANAIFTVAATGATSYQWQKDGANVSGATSSALSLSNVQAANAGSYRVVVSNSAGSVTSAAATLTVNTPTPTTGVRGDIDGDGRPDLLFQDNNGFLATWLMNGATLSSASYLSPSNVGDGNYRIVGTGDFNGDGKEDILFQHTDATLAVWYMNGTSQTGADLITPNNPGDRNWRVVAVGDVNKDGKMDLLFQHTDGTLAVWFMNGISLSSASLLTPSNPGDRNWRVVATGDLNNDTRLDLIFQHTDGTLATWFMNGTTLTTASLLTPNNPGDRNWKVTTSLDVNRDGRSDLLFQHTDGTLAVWFMNGTSLTTAQVLNPANSGITWRLVGPK
jgi:hypothetical protein